MASVIAKSHPGFRGDYYLEWKRVNAPFDDIWIASFVVISSASICAIKSTMSSTGHNSYFLGKTFGGCSSGLARLSDELSGKLVDPADG